jgi:hypothetical protein
MIMVDMDRVYGGFRLEEEARWHAGKVPAIFGVEEGELSIVRDRDIDGEGMLYYVIGPPVYGRGE